MILYTKASSHPFSRGAFGYIFEKNNYVVTRPDVARRACESGRDRELRRSEWGEMSA
jgi:hypothetical protein